MVGSKISKKNWQCDERYENPVQTYSYNIKKLGLNLFGVYNRINERGKSKIAHGTHQ
jgi:hypothetical protein